MSPRPFYQIFIPSTAGDCETWMALWLSRYFEIWVKVHLMTVTSLTKKYVLLNMTVYTNFYASMFNNFQKQKKNFYA